MTTLTVTATQGGVTGNGMLLRVLVLTGAKTVANQTGGLNNVSFTSGAASLSVTTTQTGSRVYAGCSDGSPASALTPNGVTTVIDDVADATNGEHYITWKATSLTGTPGPTTLGGTAGSSSGPLAALEVLTSGTLAEDGSAPAVVSTTSATTVTTASFTPVSGALLVALIGSDGGAGTTTMTVTDNLGTHLNWTEQVKNNASDYAGVWIADVPAGVVSPALGVLAPPSWAVTVAGRAGPQGTGHSR